MFSREEKLAWGDGPWVDEPDSLEFEYRNIRCEIHRHPYLGVFRGYIFIPKDNRYAADDICTELDVHGGVTFSAPVKDLFCIGFDCGHFNDFMPQGDYAIRKMEEMYKYLQKEKILKDEKDKKNLDEHIIDILNTRLSRLHDDKNYKDIEFVKKELRQLVDQVLDT